MSYEPTKFYYKKVSAWCHSCRYWIFSTTLGSPDKEIWHCRFGFRPYACSDGDNCIKLGDYNMRIKTKDVVQLEIPF